MQLAQVVDKDDRRICVARQSEGRLVRIKAASLLETPELTDEQIVPKRWLAPVEPRTILCIGVNYKAHAEEGGHSVPDYPVLFLKNPAAAVGHNEPICLPRVCEDEVDYEGELVVVIGKVCRNVSREEALDYVLGYTIANDVSARIWQMDKGGSQWCRGKSFDTFAPMGPVLVTPDELPDPNKLSIETRLNDKILQQDNTANMIFDVPTLISFLSQDTTLLPGTVILTGTPQGVGWARTPKCSLHSGDTVSVTIEKIGTLTNPVK